MNRWDISERVLTGLEKFASMDPRILLGYLFGSRAAGKTHDESDVDVAFLLSGHPTLEDRIGLISGGMKALNSNRVDVVLLNNATPLLCYEVVARGILFYKRNDDLMNEFESRVYREYFDTEHLRNVQNAYLKESILTESR